MPGCTRQREMYSHLVVRLLQEAFKGDALCSPDGGYGTEGVVAFSFPWSYTWSGGLCLAAAREKIGTTFTVDCRETTALRGMGTDFYPINAILCYLR